MKYNPDIHHRHSIRLKNYDYSQQGAYFITLCTYEQECLFGNIINDKMVLNKLGMIAHDEWIRSSQIRAELEINECVVMPNHVHGIVLIHDVSEQNKVIQTSKKGVRPHAPTGLMHKSIGSLIAGFKSSVTKKINEIRRMPGVPVWQRNYYDHIIRNEESFKKIRQYIINNPRSWKEDQLFLQQ